jgi:integrase
VRISRATLDLIAEHCTELDREKELFGGDYADNRLVFPRPDGRYYMPDRVTGRICEFMRKAGIKASLHSLRHLHASLLLSKAVPITVIRDRLGHASSQITLNIYSHVLKNDDARAIETWDEETSDLIRKTRVSNAKTPSESVDVRFCEVKSRKTGTND